MAAVQASRSAASTDDVEPSAGRSWRSRSRVSVTLAGGDDRRPRCSRVSRGSWRWRPCPTRSSARPRRPPLGDLGRGGVDGRVGEPAVPVLGLARHPPGCPCRPGARGRRWRTGDRRARPAGCGRRSSGLLGWSRHCRTYGRGPCRTCEHRRMVQLRDATPDHAHAIAAVDVACAGGLTRAPSPTMSLTACPWTTSARR